MAYISGSTLELNDLEEDEVHVHPKVQRCSEAASGTPPSPRYATNSAHEEVVLEQLKLFESQFRELYDKRYLFLAPPNEFGCPKFVCSSLKLTLLPYSECYDIEGLASFLADYFCYETLEPADRCPPCLPSVDCLFSWRRGDSFDMSVCLASCLLGAGYDAYCVVGTAPIAVTTNDQSEDKCPFARTAEGLPELAGGPKGPLGASSLALDEDDLNPFKIELPKTPRFEELERICKRRAQEKIEKEEAFKASGDSGDEGSPRRKDCLEGRRVHCWVLVRAGARDVPADVFINPPNGKVYKPKDSPFLSVHFLWNNENFWVNMRPKLKAQDVSFSLSNTRFFESALCMPPKVEDRDSQLAAFGADQKKQHLNALLAPRSWARPPQVSSRDYSSRFFGGQKVVFYKDAKLQEFPQYSQADGAVRILTFYADRRRNFPAEIRLQFKHRKDKLEESLLFPAARLQVDRYAAGNPHALREVVLVHGERRELHFYKSRLDGLVKHVEYFGTKIVEDFEGRDDAMLSHTVKIAMGKEAEKGQDTLMVFGTPAAILRMSAKFDRLPEKEGFTSVSKLVHWAGGRVRVDFHPPQNSIIKPVIYLKRIRTLLQYDEDAVPANGACRAPPPIEADVARYRKMQKDLLTRFSSEVLVRAEAVHEWRRQQKRSVYAARRAEEQKHLNHKVCVLRHDEDATDVPRADKAVGNDSPLFADTATAAAAAAAAAGGPAAAAAVAVDGGGNGGHAAAGDEQEQNKGDKGDSGDSGDNKHKYPFSPHATLCPSFSAIANFIAHNAPLEKTDKNLKETEPKNANQQLDLLAPYLIAYEGMKIDAEKAQEIAKRAKNDLKLRLMGKAASIQQQLEEKHDELRRIKELMQRKSRETKGDSEETFDLQEALEKEKQLAFKQQILEQRLTRHEMQALQKLNELECLLFRDPRLQAMHTCAAD